MVNVRLSKTSCIAGSEPAISAEQRTLAGGGGGGGTKQPYIRALQCAMRGCLKKATALRPNAISFLLQCGTKLPKLVLVLACFFLSCNPGAISLSRVAFHMESENTPFRLSLVLRHKSILCCLPQSSIFAHCSVLCVGV